MSGQKIVEDFTPASGNLQSNNITPVGGLFQSKVSKHDESRISNEEFCIKNEELWIIKKNCGSNNDELCRWTYTTESRLVI